MNNIEYKEELSKLPYLFALSILLIIAAFDGTFTIQVIAPVIGISLIYVLYKKPAKLKIIMQHKTLFSLVMIYTISMVYNMFRHKLELYTIIQLGYQFVIFIWFFVVTQHSFKKKELVLYCNMIIAVLTICGMYVYIQNTIFDRTTFSIITIFGNTVGKNHFSAWISFAILLSFYFVLYSKKRLKYVISLLLLALSVIFMNSRGAILSSIICCGLLFMYYLLSNGINYKKVAMVIIVGIVIIFGSMRLKSIMPPWLYNRYFVKSYDDYSNNDRLSRWDNALDGIKEQPILGFGPGVFSTLEEYQKTNFGIIINSSTPSHNTYLDVALNGGIIALITFLILLHSIFWTFIKKHRLYLPIIAHLMINTMILGAGKTVYLWNSLIFLTILLSYIKYNNDNINIFS